MDNKKRAAELIMSFLPIVGQDVNTGLRTAKDCAIAAAKIAIQAQEQMKCNIIYTQVYDYDEVIKHIEAF